MRSDSTRVIILVNGNTAGTTADSFIIPPGSTVSLKVEQPPPVPDIIVPKLGKSGRGRYWENQFDRTHGRRRK